MEERNHHPEDMHDAASVVSGLSSLENDADEFEKLMIQNERDERRLSQALGSRPQAFRKARTHPRVGLTLENLERNNAAASGTNAQPKFDSPPSSGSARSGPAIHAPATWGRKGRTSASWMRTITYEEEQQQADDAMNNHSPLSHKTSVHGTPRIDQSQEWDLTFELNEASMIASTPYIPRSTKLDDIRQREIESLKEEAVAAARPERPREGSPERSHRRPPSMRTLDSVADSTATAEPAAQTAQAEASSKKRLRARTRSWQLMGKSQPVTGMGSEDPPVAMYKSAENIAAVDREVIATAQNGPAKRMPYRREDSQDLLRRLARVSNTPSPQRVESSRPSTAVTTSTQNMPPDGERAQTENKETPAEAPATAVPESEPAGSKSESQPEQEQPEEQSQGPAHEAEQPPEPLPDNDAEYVHVDATPLPKERPVLNTKTPVVTGAWVDTPGPRTVLRAVTREGAASRSLSPRKRSPKGSLRRNKSSERPASTAEAEEAAASVALEVVRPKLHSSALQALVNEAKSQDRRQSADYGDSTINSLEELITPLPDSPPEEDTLQGIPLPTGVPRNEAERQRQQEALHLHRMADHLRATRTSLRDASRGMKRVEDQFIHVEEGENGEKIAVISRACPCAASDHVQNFSMWKWWKSLFWEQRLKTLRHASHSGWRVWGGLTGLSIFLIMLFTWWVSEEIAWYVENTPISQHLLSLLN